MPKMGHGSEEGYTFYWSIKIHQKNEKEKNENSLFFKGFHRIFLQIVLMYTGIVVL